MFIINKLINANDKHALCSAMKIVMHSCDNAISGPPKIANVTVADVTSMSMVVRWLGYHGNNPPVNYSVCVSNASAAAAAADDADWSSCQHGSHWEEIVEVEEVVTQLQPLTLYRVVVSAENGFHDVTRNTMDISTYQSTISKNKMFLSKMFTHLFRTAS